MFSVGSNTGHFMFLVCFYVTVVAGWGRDGAGRPVEGIEIVPARGGGDLDQVGHSGGEQ